MVRQSPAFVRVVAARGALLRSMPGDDGGVHIQGDTGQGANSVEEPAIDTGLYPLMGWGKSHCNAALRKFMLSSIRFINAKPPHALTSREVNLISNAAEVSHVCAITLPYLIADKQVSLMDSIGNPPSVSLHNMPRFG